MILLCQENPNNAIQNILQKIICDFFFVHAENPNNNAIQNILLSIKSYVIFLCQESPNNNAIQNILQKIKSKKRKQIQDLTSNKIHLQKLFHKKSSNALNIFLAKHLQTTYFQPNTTTPTGQFSVFVNKRNWITQPR